jgi:uncharacterized membrane protein YkvA (DUF1232 family)
VSFEGWKLRVKALKREVGALYLAMRDPRVPWYAKAMALVVVGYALSPIDLIPDFIPILGYMDDLVLVPLGILAVKALIPRGLLDEFRDRSSELDGRSYGRVAAAIIVIMWIGLAVAGAAWLYRRFGPISAAASLP